MRRAGAAAGAVVALVALACVLLVPRAASAQAGERIGLFAVDITVEQDGSLRIVEEIEYDFGSEERHGIVRGIPTRLRYDERYDRLYPLTIERVTRDGVASEPYEVSEDEAGNTLVRVGDERRTITGAHRYRIAYRVQQALNGFPDHDELYWNVTGLERAVPVERVQVAVHLPSGEVPRVACYSGPAGSALPCETASRAGGLGTFSHGALDSNEGVTVVVGWPKGVVAEPAPRLLERWSLARAFTLDVPRAATALALLAASVALVVRLVWREGRDVRWRGSPVDVVFGGSRGEQRVPLFEGGAYAIEYTPPEDIRPGEIGTLLDEHAEPRDIAASIVDLASRGYLQIEEIPAQGWFRKPDWRLVRLPPPEERRSLHEFERRLLGELFRDDGTVLLSSLNLKFAERFERVREALYGDVMEHGWFAERPDHRRTKWLVISLAVVGLAVGLEVLAVARTHLAVVPLPLVFASLLLFAQHRRMPRRTAKGTAALRRTLGFRDFIRTAETRRAEFAERANLFYDYLPYAIVFGAVDRWARTFEDLPLRPPSWYASRDGTFTAMHFGDSLDGFASSSASTLTSTPGGSGGSGFGGGSSGGGGGGGSVGSW